MYKIWDKKSDIILPNGDVLTPQDALEHPSFKSARFSDIVLEVDVDGVTNSVARLATLLSSYNLNQALTGREAINASA